MLNYKECERQWRGAEKMRDKEEEVTFFEHLLYSRQLSSRVFTCIISFNSHGSLASRYYHFPFTDKETDVAKFILIEDHTDRTRIQI